MSKELFDKLIEPVKNSIKNLLYRAIIGAVNDSTKMQLVQIEILKDEVKSDVERVQDYGFTSHPKPGAEVFVGFLNGNKDHAIAIKVDDSRFRLKDLKSGEVAVYNFKGTKIVLKDDGSIEFGAEKDIVLGNDGKVYLGGSSTSLLPTSGVLTGENLDPVTGVPFPDKSSAVFARKV